MLKLKGTKTEDEKWKCERELLELLKLKDRSICPCCSSIISKNEINEKISALENNIEDLECLRRQEKNKENLRIWKEKENNYI